MDEKLEFKINQFEGPLDLLLHLIDKNKFNIFDIPIVEITEQYLDYLNRMQEENLDVMSEFLVMAATLISIKAKMLLPREEKEEEEEEDPRAELVRRLLEYKMYKYASLELKDMNLDAGEVRHKLGGTICTCLQQDHSGCPTPAGMNMTGITVSRCIEQLVSAVPSL